MPIIKLGYTQKEHNELGSKFIVLPIDPATGKGQLGAVVIREIECGMPDWYTPGTSLKFPVKVVEDGVDKGKEYDYYAGIAAKAAFKLEEAAAAFGVPEAISFDEKGKAQIDTDLFPGKHAKGVWVGRETNAEPPSVIAKLESIIPVASSSVTEELI